MNILIPIATLCLYVFSAQSTSFKMEESNFREEHFVKSGKPSAGTSHDVVFAIKQKNIPEMKDLLMKVSDPDSSEYGKYLNRRQVAEMSSNPEATQSIIEHLQRIGAEVIHKVKYGEYITARAPLSTWEEMFSTEFHSYERRENGKVIIRAMHYSLPEHLKDHVAAVFNTVQFPVVRKRLTPMKKLDENSRTYMTPIKLQDFYNIPDNIDSSIVSQSVFEACDQTYSPIDLNLFQSFYSLYHKPLAMEVGMAGNDNACTEDADNCGEANLDVEYLTAIAQRSPTTFWYYFITHLKFKKIIYFNCVYISFIIIIRLYKVKLIIYELKKKYLLSSQYKIYYLRKYSAFYIPNNYTPNIAFYIPNNYILS